MFSVIVLSFECLCGVAFLFLFLLHCTMVFVVPVNVHAVLH